MTDSRSIHISTNDPNACLFMAEEYSIVGFPGGSGVKNLRHRFDLWVRTILWRRKQATTSVFLPGKSHGQRSLAGYIQSMGSQRVGHYLATKQQQYSIVHI